MSKRISELIKRSTQELSGYDYRFGNTITTVFDKDKFAKLLIEECAEIADRNQAENLDWDIGAIIREHFERT